MPSNINDRRRTASNKESACRPMCADISLHFYPLQLEKLIRRQLHSLTIRIVGRGSALLCRLALIFREFRLLHCNGALLLSRRLDTLMLDRIWREDTPHVDRQQGYWKPSSASDVVCPFGDSAGNCIYRRLADSNVLHVVVLH